MTTDQASSPFIRLFGRYLRDQGLPVTQQREAVAEVVFASDEHLSVDDIESALRARGDRIGKATVYRTLDLLEHMICVECGTVTEFESNELYRIENRVRAEYGFLPVRRRLEIYGLCQACQDAGVELTNEGLICPIETL